MAEPTTVPAATQPTTKPVAVTPAASQFGSVRDAVSRDLAQQSAAPFAIAVEGTKFTISPADVSLAREVQTILTTTTDADQRSVQLQNKFFDKTPGQLAAAMRTYELMYGASSEQFIANLTGSSKVLLEGVLKKAQAEVMAGRRSDAERLGVDLKSVEEAEREIGLLRSNLYGGATKQLDVKSSLERVAATTYRSVAFSDSMRNFVLENGSVKPLTTDALIASTIRSGLQMTGADQVKKEFEEKGRGKDLLNVVSENVRRNEIEKAAAAKDTTIANLQRENAEVRRRLEAVEAATRPAVERRAAPAAGPTTKSTAESAVGPTTKPTAESIVKNLRGIDDEVRAGNMTAGQAREEKKKMLQANGAMSETGELTALGQETLTLYKKN